MAKDTQPRPTLQMIGVDIGDRLSHYCGLGADGTVLEEERVATTPEALTERFGDEAATTIILEVETHSPWVSRLLTELGHRVIVANPSRVRLIAAGPRKQDRSDAETLARLGRIDPALPSACRTSMVSPSITRSSSTDSSWLSLGAAGLNTTASSRMINSSPETMKLASGRSLSVTRASVVVPNRAAIPDSVSPNWIV